MIGRTLFGYFFWRYLVTVFQFFIGVALISYLADFTEFSRRMANRPDYSLSIGLWASALRVPLIIQTAVPFVILFAGMAALMSLNRRQELVVARAAGVSAWQFLAPLCTASFLIGIFIVTVFNPIASAALSKAQEIEASLGASRSSNNIPWLRQQTEEGVTIIGAAATAQRGLLLSNATFLRLNPNGGIAERIDAEEARLEPGSWALTNATRHRRGERRVAVEQMSISTNLEPAFVEEQLAMPELIPIYELPRKIEVARAFGLSANGFATHFHTLLAMPALLTAMMLIAATVSMRFARMGQSVTIILGGILCGFLLYVVSVLVKAFGTAGFVPPAAAAWFPVLVAGFFGVTYLLYKEDG
jgi:lipopolysaccharide export system permease protein